MPLVRFKIRNELSLGGPELNRSAAVEDDEPKAILGAVEVAGLVGILRQLGDLAEFSAEVFNGIQEEVTVTASRCQKLTSRVRRIESALSPLEKAVLSQTSHIHFAYTAGCEWHPRIRNGHSHFVQSELPLCVMETYEQCRDPPPLHQLDRFNAGGPGSCLRKYSDPTFFKKTLSNPSKADDGKVQKDQTRRKRKKKTLPQRNICRSHAVSTSDETNGAHLSSVTDDKQTTSQSTSTVDMPRSSNMQDLSDIVDQSHLQVQSDAQEQSEAQVQSDFQESSKARDSITGSGYIEYVINQSPVHKPEVKLIEGFASRSVQHADKIGSAVPEGCIEVVDDNILYSPSEDLPYPCASIVCDEKKETLESVVEKTSKDEEVPEIHESQFGPGTPDMVRQNQRDSDRTYILFDEVDIVGEKQSKIQANIIDGTLGTENEGEYKSEQGSEADEFVDARNTIESESESEVDGVPKPKLEHYFGDVSTYCSEDANSDNNDGSEDIPYEQMAQDPRDPLDELCSGSYFPEDANESCGRTLSHDETLQKPREFFDISPSVLAEEASPDGTILQGPVTARPLLAGKCADEKISSEEPVSSCPSLEDAIPAEKLLPEEQFLKYSFFTEAVLQEKILPEEPLAKYPSLPEVVPNKIWPESQPLAEAVPDNMMTPAEEPNAAHPSFPEFVQEEKISPEVLDSKNLSVPEAVSQERVSLAESFGIYPCLAEYIPDEKLLTEEPATVYPTSTKAMPIEKVLPEKPLEACNYLAQLPEESILQEKSDDATHLSGAKSAPEENISADLGSTNLSVTEAVPQDKISLDEFVIGINPCLAEAVTDERFMSEEPVSTCLSLKRVVASEKVLQEELLETYPFGELPEERILHEENDDATHPSEAVSDEKFSPEVFDSTNLSLEEAVSQEEISLEEEFVDIDPCLAESVPDKRFLPEGHLVTYPSLAESQEEKILHEEEANDATHPSEAVSDEKFSPEVIDSTNSSLEEEFVPQEEISLEEEFVGIDPYLGESVPDKKFLPEEVVAIEQVLPEEHLVPYPSLGESPEEKILHEEANDTTHPSFSQAVSDEKISPEEVLGSTNLSVAEAVPQEKILLAEIVGINPCWAEAVPDERFLLEEPVTTYMTKAVASEMEAYPSLAELPEEKISHEETDDATDPSEAVSDAKFSPAVSDSSNLSLEETVQQEQISFVGINKCLAEAHPDERFLPEESVAIEGVLPEKALEVYPSLAGLHEEKILHEETDDATHPSLSEAVNDKQISPEVLDSTDLYLEQAVTREKISLEEFVGIGPCLAEDERVLPEESVTTSLSLTKEVSVEEVSPEEPLEVYAASLENLPKENISQEKSDDATHPSCAEAVSDEKVSPEVLDSTNLSVAEAIPQEQISLEEEFVGIEPCLAEAIPDERVLPEEPITTKAEPIGKILSEEPLEVYPSSEEFPEEEEPDDDTTYPSSEESALHEKISHEELVETNPFSELAVPEEMSFPDKPGVAHQSSTDAVCKEKNLLEEPTYPSLEESAPHEKTSHEELDETNPFSELAVPEEMSFPDKPSVTHQSSAEAVCKENNLLEDPLPTYPSLAEAVQDEKIYLEEPDVTCPPSSEAGFDEKASGSEEAPGSTTETVPHNKTFPEEHVATDLADKNIPNSDTRGSTTETVPHYKTFPEEPVTTDLSSKTVVDENISGSEAPGPDNNKTLPEEPFSTDQSVTKPVPDDNILPKEPVASDLALADKQVFLDDAAFLSFAEAIFDQKFSPEVPDSTYNSLTEPEPSSVSASDVSMNQNSVESVSLWSNGGLFGLAPSKPPVFAAPSEHIQNEINKASNDLPTPARKDESAEDNEKKSSLSLVVSSPTSQQQQQQSNNNILSHSNGSSFRVFGLSHRLLMAGFRGNSSSTTCKFESLPTTSCYDTEVVVEEDNKTQQTPPGDEQLDYESFSLFGSPSSSPPVQHMEISFNSKDVDVSSVSKLKLSIPSQYNGENADTFPSFQLATEASDDDEDNESDIFCQSSSSSYPCVSDNSELWESDGSPRKVGERSMGSLSGSFLDLPCFDSVDHHQSTSSSRLEEEEEQDEFPEYIPSVSEIIRDWPPNQPNTSTPSNEENANANALLKKTQNQSAGL